MKPLEQEIGVRKRAEETLQQSEGLLHAITGSAQDAIVMMDPEGRIIYWNPAAERILGFTSAEALDQDLHDLIAPARFHPAHHAAYPSFLQTGQGAAVDKTLNLEACRKDGLEISVQLSLSAVQMKDGWHAVGIIRDITGHKKAEMEIQRQATFPRFNPNPVLELSASGEITFFNHATGAMARALGLENPARMLPPNTAAMVRECLAGGAPKLRVETRVGPRVISWSFYPVKFNNTVHCYASDVTVRKQAEEALRRSETKFRTLYDSTGDAVMLLDEKGFFECNPATLTMFGCATREEFCSKHPADVSPPMQPDGTDSLTLANQQIATALEKGRHHFEWMHKRADTGEVFPTDVLLSAMELDGKQVLQAVVRDITERKRSEKSLRLQSAALEAAANAIVITDQNGTIQSVNPAFTALTGYTAQEAVGKTPRILKSGSHDEAFYRNLWQTITSGQIWSGELTNRRKDGSLYAEEMTITPLRNADGVIARYIAIKQDISDRKRAEEALRQSEEQFRAMFDLASVGIAQADPRTGQWVRVNRKMCEITGYSAGELLQMRVADITHPEDRLSDRESFERVVRGEAPDYRMEKRYIRKDGVLAWVNVNMTVIRDAAGQPIRTMAAIEDITERKRLEAHSFQSQKMETVGKLAGGIAHEFNSIMTAILGQSELMLSDLPEGNPLRKNAIQIHQAADRAATLTRQLLAYGGKQILQPDVLDLNTVLAGMENTLRHLAGRDVDVRIAPSPGPKLVKADPGQIEQVIVNIVMNAADAMPHGGKLTLETGETFLDQKYVGQFHDLKAGEYVMLAITDTGAGMSQAIKARLFEPFFTTKGVGQGTGLGLATCHGIIKQSGGQINVYSEPGRGATFKIYLPKAQLEEKPPGPPLQSPGLPRGTETILLVEDDPALREMAAELLGRLGYTVLTASDGLEALNVTNQHATGHIDLLFTDVVMPHMSGKELADRVRALYPHTRILFTSAYTENAIVHQGVLNPGILLLQKPFTPSALARKVREVLDQLKTPEN